MMIAPRWRKVVRDLAGHRFRTLLVVLSIAVGIFAIGVVMGGRGILLREFDREYAASRHATVSLVTSPVDEHVVRAVEEREDVAAADARHATTLRYTTDAEPADSSAGWESITLWGMRDPEDIRVEVVTPEQGAWPPGKGEIVLERSALQVAEYAIGDTLTVEDKRGDRHELRIAGIAHDINAFPAMFVGRITGFVSGETMELLGEPETFDRVQVVLSDPDITRARASAIAEDIAEHTLATRGAVVYNTQVPEPGSHFLGDIFKALSLLLLALGVLSLALSGFLVVNTVSAIMSQQIRQVGIMKAIGGRSAQVMRMYLAMVVVYGVLAVLVGVPAGLAAGRWFTQFAAEILNFRVESYAPPPWVLWLEIAVGVLVPVAAAWVPVRLGARVSVVRALNATGISAARFGHGLLDRVLGLLRGLPRPVALSLRNTFLRKGRLALTLTTLGLASGVVMAVLGVRATMLATVDAVDSWWAYDIQVGFEQPRPAEQVEDEALKTSGVTGVETWIERPATFEREDGTVNESLYVIGLPATTDFIVPRLVHGRWLEPGERDAIVVNTDVYADEPEMRVGRTVTLDTGGVEHDFTVVGVVQGQMMGPVIFADREDFDTVVGAEGSVTTLLAKTENHTPAGQERIAIALERRLDDAGLTAATTETQKSMRERVAGQLGILVTFLVIMAALVAAVGVIGLTGTMTINVLESTREIGVMRALGASHRSIYQIFITEGIAVGVIAWAIGTVLAYPMSWGLTVLLEEAMGMPLAFTFSWPGVGLWLAAVVLIAALASLVPAYRASQVSVRDAIAYE